jgi:hypothetical protein
LVSEIPTLENINQTFPIIPFKNEASFRISQEGSLCFPNKYWILRFDFPISEYNIQLAGVRNIFQIALRKYYHSSTDQTKETGAVDLTREQAFIKGFVLDNLDSLVSVKVPNLILLLKTITATKSSIIPFYEPNDFLTEIEWSKTWMNITPTSERQYIDFENHYAFLDVNLKLREIHWLTYTAFLSHATNDADCLVDFSTCTNFAANRIDYILSTMHTMTVAIGQEVALLERVVHSLLQHKLPLDLPKHSQLAAIVRAIRNRHKPLVSSTSEHDIHMLYTIPLTYVKAQPCKEEPCDLEVFTFYPILSTDIEYELHHITQVPSYRTGYFTNDWYEFDFPSENFLQKSTEVYLLNSIVSVNCHLLSLIDCNLCFLHEQPQPTTNPCIKRLSDSDPWKNCPYHKLSQPEEKAIQIDGNSWMFSDPNPGTLTEQCPDMDKKIFPILKTGIIRLSEECQYSMIDGPLAIQSQFTPTSLEILSGEHLTEIMEIHTNDGSITLHLRQNIFYYLFSISGVTIVTIIVLIIVCCRKPTRFRILFPTRKQKTRERRPKIFELDTAQPLYPFQRTIPSIQFGLNQTSRYAEEIV